MTVVDELTRNTKLRAAHLKAVRLVVSAALEPVNPSLDKEALLSDHEINPANEAAEALLALAPVEALAKSHAKSDRYTRFLVALFRLRKRFLVGCSAEADSDSLRSLLVPFVDASAFLAMSLLESGRLNDWLALLSEFLIQAYLESPSLLPSVFDFDIWANAVSLRNVIPSETFLRHFMKMQAIQKSLPQLSAENHPFDHFRKAIVAFIEAALAEIKTESVS